MNAYDLNFFTKTFDLGHEHFLMKPNTRCFEARADCHLGVAMRVEDETCLALSQAMDLSRPWWLRARESPLGAGGSQF
ncbi:hypothetical protein [Bradyrhizobium sp. NP1]|uniref:hypothetical protein n=1 Tax=Bradyrhizobium sp. NP1 TaxID=3049772 RepID=UPI0025A68E64|nr:hypothetical protein [Bradyrhizobium sp. NP1]WJR80428.1 hypothetical protein QOU61_11915 [Bradyrhizobium sp. NP1]